MTDSARPLRVELLLQVTCHSLGCSSGGRTADSLSVQGLLASVIAVAGTLLGSIAYVFQRVNAGRADRFAREERLRQERIAAYSGFAGAITELRRGIISLWFVRQRDDAPRSDLYAARTEADRLGAVADHARFRVQLLAEDPDLVALANAAFRPIGEIHHAADRAEFVNHENRCQDLLKMFITVAGAQVR